MNSKSHCVLMSSKLTCSAAMMENADACKNAGGGGEEGGVHKYSEGGSVGDVAAHHRCHHYHLDFHQ